MTGKLRLILALPVLIGSLLISPVAAQAAQPTSHVVISQVSFAGAAGYDEFIELYNPTDQPVSLDGWSLQYKENNFPWFTDPIPASKSIAAHGYFLLRPFAVGGGDANYATFLMNDTTGDLFLAKTTTPITDLADSNLVDRLSYGYLGQYPEGTVAASPSAGQSLERLPGNSLNEGNGIDTNNNAADFLIRTATPRSTQSPAQSPASPVIGEVSPAPDSYLTTQQVKISAQVSDQAGFDATAGQLWIDGSLVSTLAYDAATGTVMATPTLDQGTHTALIRVTDRAGFSTDKQWIFTVDSLAPMVKLEITRFAPVTNQLETTVKLQATDDPLGKASGVTQMQVAFDGVLDNEPWEAFQASFTRNLMNKEGLQAVAVRVRDRAGNISQTATATTTLKAASSSPIVALTTPTKALSSTVLSSNGNTIFITWEPVQSATHYLVRYSNGQALFGPLTVTANRIEIGGLKPDSTYSFEVAAVNATGSVSGFAKIVPELPAVAVATPVVAQAPAAPAETDAASAPVSSTSTASEANAPTPSASVSPSPEASPSPTPSSEVKGGQDQQNPDWSRVIVALSILIIAAGVATGGWYLYQWWTSRPTDGNKPKGKGGRW